MSRACLSAQTLVHPRKQQARPSDQRGQAAPRRVL
jgi:hypothetical protein